MAHVWSPEEIRKLETKIKAARAGDVYTAVGLLHRTIHCLERDLPLPEPLRRYLIDAFRQITMTSPADVEEPPPIGPNANKLELRKLVKRMEKTRDANAALNLKPGPGRRRSSAVDTGESFLIGTSVSMEMENKGKSWEEAIGAVADRLGVSERTVSRAWSKYKKIPRLHDKK